MGERRSGARRRSYYGSSLISLKDNLFVLYFDVAKIITETFFTSLLRLSLAIIIYIDITVILLATQEARNAYLCSIVL